MPVIAIDGPSGAGKSTVAAAIAERLGLERLDTGAMYRAVTLVAMRKGVGPDDGAGLGELVRGVTIEVGERVLVDGLDVTDEIRSPAVTATVSQVSAHPAVREVLVDRQRSWVAQRQGGVVEGRDIGSVVFPDAELKLFLTADMRERALRRACQEGISDERRLDDLESAMGRRDGLDKGREASPLVTAADAHVIDSTGRSVEDVVEEALSLL
jgi:cytidylate kinase